MNQIQIPGTKPNAMVRYYYSGRFRASSVPVNRPNPVRENSFRASFRAIFVPKSEVFDDFAKYMMIYDMYNESSKFHLNRSFGGANELLFSKLQNPLW